MQILTHETAKFHFERYGTPDGRGVFNVGIALPKTLQEKDQQIFVLITAFILITFVIPGYFYSELFKEESDIGGVSTQNRKIFKDLIDHNTLGKAIPGVLGQGEEFVSMKVRSKKEFEFMQSIKSNPEVKPAIPK